MAFHNPAGGGKNPPAGVFGEELHLVGVIGGINKPSSARWRNIIIVEEKNMKRAFVFLLAVFMTVGAIGSAFAAESALSPAVGLRFNDPNDSIVNDVRISLMSDTESSGYRMIIWSGDYVKLPVLASIGTIVLSVTLSSQFQENYYDFLYDSLVEGEAGIVKKGPKELLAGLPAFYVISEIETTVGGAIYTKNKFTRWYIVCKGRFFQIIFDRAEYISSDTISPDERQRYNDQLSKIFEDFLKNLNGTDLGGSSGGGGSGSSGGGGCNVSGGLFSILSLAVFYALRRNKI